MDANVEDVAAAMESAKDDRRDVCFLIGAGFSREGGIPCVPGFVQEIKKHYEIFYKKAKRKAYQELMKALPYGYRRDLIARLTANARINMAHLFLALFVARGYVSRILTTNFDSLLTQACSLLATNIFVYDLADCRGFSSADIRDRSVLYLHGRDAGFNQLSTKAECKRQREILSQIFDQSIKKKVWIVVGYSGNHDPIFEHLARINRFDYGLYWVCYNNEDPPKHARSQLLIDDKYAYEVKGFTADSFFIALAQKLNCLLPDFIRWPTPQIKNQLDQLAPYSGPFQNNGFKFDTKPIETERVVMSLKNVSKEERNALTMLAGYYLLAKRYDEVIALLSGYDLNSASELSGILASTYMMKGWLLYDEADKKSGEEAEQLKAKAGEMFYKAENAKPGMAEEVLGCSFQLRGE